MRKILISGFLVLATMATAAASDRYPTAKRYVNQTGQVMAIGEAPAIIAYAPLRIVRQLPALRAIATIQAPVKLTPARSLVSPIETSARGLFGGVNIDPSQWPSGRTCCRPGEPYFNENPDS